MTGGRHHRGEAGECMSPRLLFLESSPHGHARFAVQSAPSDQLAFTNCLIVNEADFPSGMHVLVKQAYPLTTRCACLPSTS